jgi:hypothetical protein
MAQWATTTIAGHNAFLGLSHGLLGDQVDGELFVDNSFRIGETNVAVVLFIVNLESK